VAPSSLHKKLTRLLPRTFIPGEPFCQMPQIC
jgi:hypothetical protein